MTRPSFPPSSLPIICLIFVCGIHSHAVAASAPALIPTDTHPATGPEGDAEHEPTAAPPPAAEEAPASPSALTTPADPPNKKAPAPKPGSTEPGPSAPARPNDPAAAKSHATEEVQSLLRLGPTLTDRGDYQAAEIAFHQVLRHPVAQEADIKGALLGLARMHRKQGSFTKAVAVYERFLKDYPNDERLPDALLDLGRTFRDLGIHKLALGRFYSVLNSTLKVSGGNFEHYQLIARTAQFEIAQTHLDAGEYAEANKFFTRLRLLDLAPADRARAHFMSAYALRLQGDRENAVTTLRSFIEQSPDDENIPEARYLLAITLRELNRPQEAFAATLELLRREQDRNATNSKRWAYWQRRTGNQLANEFFETGDLMSAHSIYTSLVQLSPEPAWRLPLLYQIGLCQERLGSIEQARGSYQSVVEAASASPTSEFAELAKMAAWRLEHLNWRERVDQQLTTFFSTTTGKQAATSTPSSDAAATP